MAGMERKFPGKKFSLINFDKNYLITMTTNEDIKESPSAAEDAAFAMMESMSTQTTKTANTRPQAACSYFKKGIALLKKFCKKNKR